MMMLMMLFKLIIAILAGPVLSHDLIIRRCNETLTSDDAKSFNYPREPHHLNGLIFAYNISGLVYCTGDGYIPPAPLSIDPSILLIHCDHMYVDNPHHLCLHKIINNSISSGYTGILMYNQHLNWTLINEQLLNEANYPIAFISLSIYTDLLVHHRTSACDAISVSIYVRNDLYHQEGIPKGFLDIIVYILIIFILLISCLPCICMVHRVIKGICEYCQGNRTNDEEDPQMTSEPSRERLINETTHLFNEELVVNGGSPSCCSICLNDFINGDLISRLPCGHVFHPHCIQSWISRGTESADTCTCPVCRRHVTTGSTHANYGTVN
jgi:hypothetical protein